MTRSEAEEMFIAVVMSGETAVLELSLKETQVFRVLIGRALREMERKNHTLWMKARDYGIEFKMVDKEAQHGYAIIRKLDSNRYKLFTVGTDGKLVPFVRDTGLPEVLQSTTKIDIPENNGGEVNELGSGGEAQQED